MENTLRGLRELGLLDELQPILERHTSGMILGTGDDVAIVRSPGNARLVWTIDTMVEGTHFRFWDDPLCTARALGAKLVVSNVSDLASKGARPLWALISLGLPAEASITMVRDLYAGIDERLMRHGGRLVGGDTVRAPVWTLTMALAGMLEEGASVASRDRAAPGHSIYVTGWPGESGAGFAILEGRLTAEGQVRRRLLMRHLCPTACLDVGVTLATAFEDLAMIDVSDGIASDCGQVARASKCALVLHEEALPVSESLAAAAQSEGVSPLDFLLHGGEDYELLFTTAAAPEHVQAALAEHGHMMPVHCIGHVEAGSGVWLQGKEGGRKALAAEGFEHFA